MKPILIVPLTSEDADIWHEHVLTERLDPYFEGMHLWQHSQAADRRDAELMRKLSLSAQVLKRPAARVWVVAVALLEKGLPE